MGNVLGDPFALATISIAAVRIPIEMNSSCFDFIVLVVDANTVSQRSFPGLSP